MPNERSGGPKILGVPDSRLAQPLWHPLRGRPEFRIEADAPARLAIQLRNHSLHAAILTPLDYARDYAMYRIVPRVAVTSKGESRTVLLQFKQGLRSIRTIAVDPRSASEIVLARLILAEKYDTHVTFVPTDDAASPRTDARLVLADHAVDAQTHDAIDLVDEWTDLTGLPFVHGMWVSRDGDLTEPEMNLIVSAPAQPGTSPIRYQLDDEAIGGLTEFLRMAYYHGVLNDIADVKLLGFETNPQPGTDDGTARLN